MSSEALSIAGYMAAEVAALLACDRFVTPKSLKKTRAQFANNAVSLAHAFLLVGNAAAAVWSLRTSRETRWFGNTPAGTRFMCLYCAHNLVNVGIDLFLSPDMKPAQKAQMLGHHLLSVVAYAGGIVTKRMAFWACLDGMCEITNVFLDLLLLTKHKEAGVGEKISAALGMTVQTINGFLLWLSFIVFRVALFPSWLAVFAWDVYKLRQSGQLGRLSTFELTFYPATTLFLWCLSVMWFRKIHTGMVKALSSGSTSSSTSDDSGKKEE